MCGWVIGFSLSVIILSKLFNSHIYGMSSLFLGLSIFALPLIIKEEKGVLKGKYGNLIFTILGIAVVVLITYLNPTKGSGNIKNISNLSIGVVIYIFVSAMIAISAMVLPGISGSTLLLILGIYVPIINQIKELLHFNFSYLPTLIVFGLGVITGILTVIKLVKKGLKSHRSKMIYLIIGLMVGSLYAIIMGPTTLDVPKAALSFSTFNIITFMIGGVILVGLEIMKTKLIGGNKNEKSE